MAYKDPESRKKYRALNKERINAIKRAWSQKNIEKVRQGNRESRLRHRDKRIAESRAWAEKNHDYILEYHKKYSPGYYLKNKEKIDKNNREYAKNNRKKMVKNVQRYVGKNKEKVYGYGKGYNLTSSGGYRSYKSNAFKRGREFTLNLEQFEKITKSPCKYCDETEKRRGIDRLDNSKGYTEENSVPCCKICNYMKKNYSVEDFIAHIKKVASFNT